MLIQSEFFLLFTCQSLSSADCWFQCCISDRPCSSLGIVRLLHSFLRSSYFALLIGSGGPWVRPQTSIES